MKLILTQKEAIAKIAKLHNLQENEVEISDMAASEKEVYACLQRGDKIGAIKLIKEILGVDLKAAKDLADQWSALYNRG